MPVELPTSFLSETTREIVREAAADAPTILGVGLETITGIAVGGGGLAAAFGVYRIARRLLQRNRPAKGDGTRQSTDPFPRRLDEARQHRELRQYTERRCPEFDAAVGRVIQDELDLYKRTGTAEDNATLKEFWERVRGRVDALMPPSTREYLNQEG